MGTHLAQSVSPARAGSLLELMKCPLSEIKFEMQNKKHCHLHPGPKSRFFFSYGNTVTPATLHVHRQPPSKWGVTVFPRT